MKVVINTGVGGFCLSPKAILYIAGKQGKPCYFYDLGWDDINKNNQLTPIVGLPDRTVSCWVASSASTADAIDYETNVYDSRHREFRHDPLLVEAVEVLGDEANGDFTTLKIIDIPDGVEYVICEQDCGIEWVAEKHRTWY